MTVCRYEIIIALMRLTVAMHIFLPFLTRHNSEGDYYNNRANCDTSMKLGRDGQFDTLKKIGCGHKLKNAPLCYF